MQQTSGGVHYQTRLNGESDAQGIVHEIEIWTHQRIVYAQTRIWPGEWDAENYMGFWNKTDQLIVAIRQFVIITKNKKKKKIEPTK